MHSRYLHKSFFAAALLIVVAAVFGVLGAHTNADVEVEHDIVGWGWSDNIGWISMDCENENSCGTIDYGVDVNSNGFLSGYAWSNNIGWITFNSDELSGCPEPACNARIQDGELKGWAKALSTEGNGWDGFISLSGDSPAYGPELKENDSGDTYFEGFVWGSDVVGWVEIGLNPYEPPECNDNIDNDGDGWIDYPNDPQCDSLEDDDESGTGDTECSDGIDNDGDGLIDGNDPGCTDASDDDETDPRDFSLEKSNNISVTLIGDDRSGTSNEATITVNASNTFTSPVSLSVLDTTPDLPGATYTFGDSELSESEYDSGSSFTVTVPANTQSGEYTITVKGEGQGGESDGEEDEDEESGTIVRTVDVVLMVDTKDPQFENF